MYSIHEETSQAVDHDFQQAWGGALTDLSSDNVFSTNQKESDQELSQSQAAGEEPFSDEQFIQSIKSCLFEGRPLSILYGVTESQMETVYAVAYRYYSVGEYLGAVELFRWLLSMDSSNRRYAFGFAASLQASGFYEDAIEQYLLLYLQKQDDPLVPLHAGICHLALKNYHEAESAFTLSFSLAQHDKQRYADYYERAEVLLKHVQKLLYGDTDSGKVNSSPDAPSNDEKE